MHIKYITAWQLNNSMFYTLLVNVHKTNIKKDRYIYPAHSGPRFTKRTDILPRDFVRSEAARLDVVIMASLWTLTGIAAALLPRCLSNFRAIKKIQTRISRLRGFMRSCNKKELRRKEIKNTESQLNLCKHQPHTQFVVYDANVNFLCWTSMASSRKCRTSAVHYTYTICSSHFC